MVAFFLHIQRPEKYLGDLATWDRAEKALEDALNSFNKPWEVGLLALNRFNLEAFVNHSMQPRGGSTNAMTCSSLAEK